MNSMNYLTISGLLIFGTGIFCSLAVLMSRPVSFLKSTWGLFGLAVGLWGEGLYLAYSANEYYRALFWLRFLNLFSIIIPVFFVHFVILFTGKSQTKAKEMTAYYVTSLIIIISSLIMPSFFIPSLSPQAGFYAYPNLGPLYYVLFLFSVYLAVYAAYLLIRFIKSAPSVLAGQGRYILLGTAVCFLGESTVFLPAFNIPVLLLSTTLVILYLSSITYAIVRYRLMDIRLAVSNTAIFIGVYALVLGIPFYLYSIGYKLIAFIQVILLATTAPFIYLYFQRKAADLLLDEQRRYQETLRQASAGMGRIKDLKKLLNMVVYVLTHVIQIEHAIVYIYDQSQKRYVIGASKKRAGKRRFIDSIEEHSPLVQFLSNNKDLIVYEEIKQKSQDDKNHGLEQIVKIVSSLEGELLVPVFNDQILIAIIVMGKKGLGKIYTEDDLGAFSILANQIALAIENCLFMQAEKDRIKKEGAQARRESLDMLVGTMAHEIDNPITIVVGEAEELQEDIKSKQGEIITADFIKGIIAACNKIKDNAWRVSKIIKAVEDYAKAESGQYKAVLINNVMIPFRSFLLLLSKKYPGIQFTQDIQLDLPPVWAEEVTIEEILFNYVENAFHAAHRHNARGEGKVSLHIFKRDDFIIIEVSDNGYGVEAKVLKQLFQVPTTTKGSAEGTGIGLYRVRQVVDRLKGQAWAESQGKAKGAKFIAQLPVYKGDASDTTKTSSQRIF
ncbi:MAG: GHKL domain-containing protein [Candidatus Omnitrophica bacterium]|nr:GHKL domain-containing protein [Candidatus Omnitrophota bacterium]